jgi:GalNAc-alpha-(1->4)-GalNAc-alpha-(1->3)-diNAcBac-PP-undecaprenol alpha-1,4-N-acetyl-D-galactosaminyltransferase
MQIVFVIYSLQAGGAERVLSIMANHWAGNSHKVTVITLDDGEKPSFYDIDSRIQQVSLDVAAVSKNGFVGILNNIRRIYKLRTAIRKTQAETIISFMTETNVLTLIASYGLCIPVIVTEHTDPWTGPVGDVWSKLRLRLYPRASRVVVLNQRAQEFFDKSQDIRTLVMPNPVVIEDDTEPGDLNIEASSGHLIVAMGRLSQEKRFDLLIRAYSSVATEYSEWNLMILGDGPERQALETLREELGLGDRIMLPGTVRHPHQLLKKADMFVSSSELEGFPMALCEAMACGLPVIAAEYHSAVHDIVEDGHNGIIVPAGDEQVLADTMIQLIEDPGERTRLAANSPEIGIRFSVDAIMKRWEQLLKEVTFSQNRAPV